MAKPTTDELRKQVWDALTRAEGDRERAAELMGVSLRTLNRYIAECKLYTDIDKAGLKRNEGPPRGAPRGTSIFKELAIAYIRKHGDALDRDAMAESLWPNVPVETRKQRLYELMNRLKTQGEIATDGERWFVV